VGARTLLSKEPERENRGRDTACEARLATTLRPKRAGKPGAEPYYMFLEVKTLWKIQYAAP
jgi:hypothetical protein